MKIYNKKNFRYGLGMTILGILMLLTSIWKGFDVKGTVILALCLFLGGTDSASQFLYFHQFFRLLSYHFRSIAECLSQIVEKIISHSKHPPFIILGRMATKVSPKGVSLLPAEWP